MKKILLPITLIALFLGVTFNTATAQNDADPAVTACGFSKSPIHISEQTSLSIFVSNEGFTTNLASGSIGLRISLPVTFDYSAYPESQASITGDYASKFNWSYNPGTKQFTGTLNADIAPGDGGLIIINVKGNQVENNENSSVDVLLLNPAAYPNDDNSNNDLSASMSVSSGTLPISLLSFDAVKQSTTARLTWVTTSETNSKAFDIQSSTNGVTWSSIGTILAAGNSSSTQHYTFTDNTPAKGTNYYRLKMIDIDARFSYSLIRTIAFSSNTSLVIQPNPTTDKLYLTSDDIGRIQYVAIYAGDGKLMQVIKSFATSNSIDMQAYAPAIYLLKIIYKDGSSQTERIVKK